jgi:hypothetical protein
MRVEVQHRFEGAQLGAVERLYMLDDEFNQLIFRALGFERKVVRRSMHEQRLERTLRLCPVQALPKPFASLVPSGAFFIEEQVQYDFSRHEGVFVTRPSVLTQQFRAEGTIALFAEPHAVLFRLSGEAHASLSLLSNRAERQAVRTAEAQHAALADAIRVRLDAAPHSATLLA